MLRDPVALTNLSPEEQAHLRKQLSDAVELTATLGTIDATTAASLITALNAIVLSSSEMDAELFNQVLNLVRRLAANAGEAAAALLDIVAAMLRNREVASADEAETINDSLEDLTLALLETAVCGEAGRTVDGDGIQLNAAFKSSFTGESYELLGGAGASFGDMSQFDALGGDVVDDSICTKSQLLVQTSSPYTASNASEIRYVWASVIQRPKRAATCSRKGRAFEEPYMPSHQACCQCHVLHGVALRRRRERQVRREPHGSSAVYVHHPRARLCNRGCLYGRVAATPQL